MLAVAAGLSTATLALRSFALLFLTILVWVNGTMSCIDTCFVRWSIADVHPATVAYWNRRDEYSDIVRIAGIVACSMAMMVALSPRSLRQIYTDKAWLRRALQARDVCDR